MANSWIILNAGRGPTPDKPEVVLESPRNLIHYTNKAITVAEMISRFLDLAKHLRNAQRHGEELGLSREETAFYDALAKNGSAKEFTKYDTLRLMARELTEMVKKMPKLDWTQRESVRAGLRRNVRCLLAKYGLAYSRCAEVQARKAIAGKIT